MYKKKTQGAGYALARSKKTMIPVVWWAAMGQKAETNGPMAPICLEVESNRGNPLFGHKKAKKKHF